MAFPTGWNYYQVVTLPAIGGMSGSSISDFPYLIANLPAAVYNHARSDGGDIRFTTSDGSTQIPVEVVLFDAVNSKCEIWVKAPTISKSSTNNIRVYYGAASEIMPAANSTYGSQAVWDSNFKGVWHMPATANGDTGGYPDSTSNANHMTGTSMSISPSAGPWGSGYSAEFDGAADYMGCGALFSAYPISFSAWIYPDSEADGTYHVVGEKDYQTSWTEMNALWLVGNDSNDPVWAYSRNPTELYSAKTDFAATTWQHVGATFNTASRIAYLDGAGGTAETTSDAYASTPNHFSVGGLYIGWSLYADMCFDGKIDEVRASSSIRSADWLYVEYYCGANPTAPTYGGEVSASGFASNLVKVSKLMKSALIGGRLVK